MLLPPFDPTAAWPAEWLAASDPGADGADDFATLLTLESQAAQTNLAENTFVAPPLGSDGAAQSLPAVEITNTPAVRAPELAEKSLAEPLQVASWRRNTEPPRLSLHASEHSQPIARADNAPNHSSVFEWSLRAPDDNASHHRPDDSRWMVKALPTAALEEVAPPDVSQWSAKAQPAGAINQVLNDLPTTSREFVEKQTEFAIVRPITVHQSLSVKLAEAVAAAVAQAPEAVAGAQVEFVRVDFTELALAPTVKADTPVGSDSELSTITKTEVQVRSHIDVGVEGNLAHADTNPLSVEAGCATASVSSLNCALAPDDLNLFSAEAQVAEAQVVDAVVSWSSGPQHLDLQPIAEALHVTDLAKPQSVQLETQTAIPARPAAVEAEVAVPERSKTELSVALTGSVKHLPAPPGVLPARDERLSRTAPAPTIEKIDRAVQFDIDQAVQFDFVPPAMTAITAPKLNGLVGGSTTQVWSSATAPKLNELVTDTAPADEAQHAPRAALFDSLRAEPEQFDLPTAEADPHGLTDTEHPLPLVAVALASPNTNYLSLDLSADLDQLATAYPVLPTGLAGKPGTIGQIVPHTEVKTDLKAAGQAVELARHLEADTQASPSAEARAAERLDRIANQYTVWGGLFTHTIANTTVRVNNPPHNFPDTQLQTDLVELATPQPARPEGQLEIDAPRAGTTPPLPGGAEVSRPSASQRLSAVPPDLRLEKIDRMTETNLALSETTATTSEPSATRRQVEERRSVTADSEHAVAQRSAQTTLPIAAPLQTPRNLSSEHQPAPALTVPVASSKPVATELHLSETVSRWASGGEAAAPVAPTGQPLEARLSTVVDQPLPSATLLRTVPSAPERFGPQTVDLDSNSFGGANEPAESKMSSTPLLLVTDPTKPLPSSSGVLPPIANERLSVTPPPASSEKIDQTAKPATPSHALATAQRLPELTGQPPDDSAAGLSATSDFVLPLRSPQPRSAALFRTLLAEPERLGPPAFEPSEADQTAFPLDTTLSDIKAMEQPRAQTRNDSLHQADWTSTETSLGAQVYPYAGALRMVTAGLRQPTEPAPFASVGLPTPEASATKHLKAVVDEKARARENTLLAVAAPTTPDGATGLRSNEPPRLPATTRSILSTLQTELPTMTQPTLSPTLQLNANEPVAGALPAAQISEFAPRPNGVHSEPRVFVQVQTALNETSGQTLPRGEGLTVTVPASTSVVNEAPELRAPRSAPSADNARVTDRVPPPLERLSTNFAAVNAAPANRRGAIETRAPHETLGEANFNAPLTAQPAAPGIQLAQVTISSTPGHVAKQLAEPLLAASEYVAPGAARSLRLKLRPQELGQVEVEITRDATGRVSAQLKVEYAQTNEILRGELPLLREALERAGLQVGRLEVTIDAGSAGFGGQTGGQAQQPDYTDHRMTGRAPDSEYFVLESTLNGGAQAAQDRLLNLHA